MTYRTLQNNFTSTTDLFNWGVHFGKTTCNAAMFTSRVKRFRKWPISTTFHPSWKRITTTTLLILHCQFTSKLNFRFAKRGSFLLVKAYQTPSYQCNIYLHRMASIQSNHPFWCCSNACHYHHVAMAFLGNIEIQILILFSFHSRFPNPGSLTENQKLLKGLKLESIPILSFISDESVAAKLFSLRICPTTTTWCSSTFFIQLAITTNCILEIEKVILFPITRKLIFMNTRNINIQFTYRTSCLLQIDLSCKWWVCIAQRLP